MKVVVCGGAGYLGSHVADALTARGHDVTIYDLARSRYLQPGQRMVVGDALDLDLARATLSGCDVVYHFAGLADLDVATTQPLETIRQNIAGTTTLLQAAVDARVRRFMYASTVYVYSGRGGFYRCSKQAAELYVEEFQSCHGLDYTILRYGSLYGPRADARNALYRYLKQGLSEGRITFGGSPDDVREYVHVRDAARLSVDALAEEFRNRHLVITGHHPTRAADLLIMLKEILNRTVEVEFADRKHHAHYMVTPYQFMPKVGHKLIGTTYTDMGQGLLEWLHELHAEE